MISPETSESLTEEATSRVMKLASPQSFSSSVSAFCWEEEGLLLGEDMEIEEGLGKREDWSKLNGVKVKGG